MRRVLFITLGILVVLGIGLVVAVTATSDEPSLPIVWAALAGTVAALVIVLVLESGESGADGATTDD